MPNIWTAVDANFPTIDENGDTKEQLSKIVNYMYVLQEQLKYTLENLDQSNWNGTALQTYSAETNAPVQEQQNSISEQLTEVNKEIERLDRRLTAIANTVSKLVGD